MISFGSRSNACPLTSQENPNVDTAIASSQNTGLMACNASPVRVFTPINAMQRTITIPLIRYARFRCFFFLRWAIQWSSSMNGRFTLTGWVLVNKKNAKYAREAKNKAEDTT